jgi:hypothetical protein
VYLLTEITIVLIVWALMTWPWERTRQRKSERGLIFREQRSSRTGYSTASTRRSSPPAEAAAPQTDAATPVGGG